MFRCHVWLPEGNYKPHIFGSNDFSWFLVSARESCRKSLLFQAPLKNVGNSRMRSKESTSELPILQDVPLILGKKIMWYLGSSNAATEYPNVFVFKTYLLWKIICRYIYIYKWVVCHGQIKLPEGQPSNTTSMFWGLQTTHNNGRRW